MIEKKLLSEQLRIEPDGIFLKNQMIRDIKGKIQKFETAENEKGNKMIMASEETNGKEHYIRFSHYESPNEHAECEIVPLNEEVKAISLQINQEGREAVITTASGKQMFRWWH